MKSNEAASCRKVSSKAMNTKESRIDKIRRLLVEENVSAISQENSQCMSMLQGLPAINEEKMVRFLFLEKHLEQDKDVTLPP